MVFILAFRLLRIGILLLNSGGSGRVSAGDRAVHCALFRTCRFGTECRKTHRSSYLVVMGKRKHRIGCPSITSWQCFIRNAAPSQRAYARV